LPVALLLLMLMALDPAWLRPASAAGTVHYVATSGVDTGNCASLASPCRTVHYAIGAAQSGDEVRVAQGTYNDMHMVGSITQVVYLSRSLTLRGGYTTTDWSNSFITRSTILDAGGKGRVVYVAANVTATIEGFTITNGFWSGDGGGIYVASGGSSIVQSNFIANNVISATSTSRGGGIFVASSNSIVRMNRIYSNQALGVQGQGGGVAVLTSPSFTPIVESNYIYSNSASGGTYEGGGGIYLSRDVGGGPAQVRGNFIYSNTITTGYGGGLFVFQAGNVSVEQNDIHYNTASSGANAGALYVRESYAVIRNNLVYSNVAPAGATGGLYYFGDHGTFENNTVYGNTGGGIYVQLGSAPPVTIRNNVVVSNTSTGIGSSGSLTVNYTDAWGNSVNYGATITGTGNLTVNPQFVSPGVDFRLQTGSPVIDAADPNNPLNNDYAGYGRPFGPRADMGAHEYHSGQCFARVNGVGPVYTNTQIAVSAVTTSTDVVRVAGVCQGVSAADLGGSLYTYTLFITRPFAVQGGYTVSNWTTSNPAVNWTTLDAQGLGGGVLISTTNAVTVEAVRFVNGLASQGGGARVNAGTATFSVTTMSANTADRGGGLYVVNGNVTMLDSTVADNSATSGEGGGIYSANGALTVRRSAIYSNTSTSSGGGVYNNATALLDANRMYANLSPVYGGAFCNNFGAATLRNNMIYTNTALYGGGVYVSAGTAAVENNTFFANRADNRGGALCQAGGTTYITNTLIISNTGVITGGGVHVMTGTAALDYNDLFGNIPNAGNIVTGTHSIAKAPLFVNSQTFDLHLMPDSPAVDVGLFLPWLTSDFDGDVRPLGLGFDMGADERAPSFVPDYVVAGLPGSMVVYDHIITNTTSLQDTFSFAYFNSAPGWLVTPPATVTVSAGASQNVQASVIVPTGYLSGTWNTTMITATSQNSGRAAGVVRDTTLVARVIGISITENLSATLLPGDTYTYTHWVTNTGNYTDTFMMTLSSPWAGFVTLPPVPPGSPMYITLGPALAGYTNSQQIVLTVTVPLTAPAFLQAATIVQATSTADGSTAAQVIDLTTAKATIGTRYVHLPPSGNDSTNNCTQSAFPCATVQHAVEQASQDDTIAVAGGIYYETELRINKNVNLLGGYSPLNWTAPRDPGINLTYLDGNDTSRVIYIPGSSYAPLIDGFIVRNGHTDGVGGGLYVEISAWPTLRNVRFENNRADSRGGAIYIAGGGLYLDNVLFTGNAASQGAGVYNGNATLTFSGTLFYGNGDASTLAGGAVYNGGGSLTIQSQSVLRGNTAQAGGALYHLGGNLVITNTRIVTNTTTGNGGGLYGAAGTGTLFNNLIYSNTSSGNGGGLYFSAGAFTFSNNTVYGNAAAGSGGGLYASSATMMITNNIVAQNAAANYGGLYAAGAATADYNDVWSNTPNDSNIALGTHSLSADPLFQDVSAGDFSLVDLSPAIDNGDPNTHLSYDYAYDPRPAGQGYDMGAFELGGCFARVNHWGTDGPIYFSIQAAISTVQAYTDVVKVAGTCLGVHPLQVGSTTIYQGVHITQTFILRGGYSASIWNDPPQGLPAVVNAQSRGRAIYISGNISPTIENMVLANGSATNLGGGPGSLDAGGALYNSSARVILSGTSFYSSSAAYGGGLYNGDSGAITVTAATIGGNAASQSGGGLYNYDGRLVVGSSIITGNTASAGGGAFNSQFGTLTISRTEIVRNSAAAGGGLYNDLSTATLQSDSLHDNTASGSGGGVYVTGGTLYLQNTMLYSNTASSGAGGGLYLSSGTADTSFNTWYNNRASGDGGAIYKASGSLWLNNSILITNTAASGNGASLFNGSGSATLDYNDMSSANPASIVGASVGAHSFFADPWFADPARGDLHLRAGSPAMDKGDPSSTLTFDIDGDIRPSMFGIDVGADEIGGCYVRLNNGTTTYGSLPKVIAMSTSASDVVKIAGRCVGVQAYIDGGTPYTQSVYLTKTLTLRGGYSPTNWILSDPFASPTYVDAVGLGRVVVVTGTVTPTIEGLMLVNGSAALGGGPNTGGSVYVVSGSPVFSTTWILSGTAQLGGGLYNANSNTTVRNSVVATNTATSGGGGLYNNGTLTVRRSQLYHNSAPNGGAIYNRATAAILSNKIYTNTAISSGGGVYNETNQATLQSNMLYDNAASDGGAVHVAGGSAIVELDTLYRNRASNRGGGIYGVSGASVYITSTIVATNTAITGSFGIHLNGTTNSLDYNDVISNTPSNSDVPTGTHSLAVDPLFVNAGQFDLHLRINSPLIDRAAPTSQVTEDFEGDPRPGLNGYDIGADEFGNCLALNSRTNVLYGSVQRAHDAAQAGDLIKLAGYCWGVQGVVAGAQTYTQTLFVTKPLTFRGGYTITNWSTSYPISQPTTLDARGLGRVVWVSSTLASTLDSIWVVGGRAAQGGGLYNLSSPVVLSHTTFFSNTATGEGGAIYNNGGQPTLIGNTIYSNTAAGDGGGFYNAASGNPILHNNVFYWNTATAGNGGAIYAQTGAATIRNNTLYANRAIQGGAIYNTGAGLSLINTILMSNTATTNGGLHDYTGASTVDYDLWWGNLPNHANGFTGTHSLTADPQFVNARAGDFHLDWASPAIDVGDPATTLNLDFENEPRPLQYSFDIGADEYAGCYARLNHLGYDYPIVYYVQDAIDAATLPSDTIKVAGRCWGIKDIGGARQVAYINKPLILQGGYSLINWTVSNPSANPTYLEARGRGRVVYVGPVTVTINALRMSSGDASQAGLDPTVGGGIFNNGGNLTLMSSVVNTNTAVYGGGLYNNQGRVTLNQNSFLDNYASNSGGGLYNNGTSATMSWSDNNASNNTALVHGGGLYGGGGNIAISAPTNGNDFWYNTAGGDGGALYLASGNLNIQSSCGPCTDFYFNQAGGNGGALYMASGTSVESNLAWYYWNTATSNGGAIFNNGGTFTAPNGRFVGNTAINGGGGGYYQASGSSATLYNQLVTNNQSPQGSGGGFHNNAGQLVGINNTVVNNSARDAGGGFYGDGGAMMLTNTIFVSNTATAPSTGSGGGIHCTSGSTCSEEYNDFWMNWAISDPDYNGVVQGDALHTLHVDPLFTAAWYDLRLDSPCIDTGRPVPVYEDATGIPRPQGPAWDMGRYEFVSNARVEVTDSTRYADPGQTVVHVNRITNLGSITDTFALTITGQWLTGTYPATTPPLGPGQSYQLAVTVTVPLTATICDESIVTKIARSMRDPNIYGQGEDTTRVNLIADMTLTPDPNAGSARPGETITYTHVLSNNVNTCGAGSFYVVFNNSQYSWSPLSQIMTLTRGTTATIQVPINIYQWAPVNVVDQATVKASLVISPALYVIAGDNTTILPAPATRYVTPNGTDDSNCSDRDHGACRTVQYAVSQASPGDEIHVTEGTYTGTLSIGKTVIVQGGYTNTNWSLPPAPVRQVSILDAESAGRVISISGSITPVVSGFAVTRGSATDGAGIYVDALTATLSSNAIYRNTATNSGAGVYVRSGVVALQNNVIYSNTAANGGGIHVYSGTTFVENNTVYGNTAGTQGGALYNAPGATARVTNTIFANNAAGGFDIYNAGVTITMDYNDVSNDTSNVPIGSNSITATPQFVNASAGDFHLSASSPAIDRGTTLSTVRTDYEGDVRPQIGGYDIGADELQATASLQLTPATASRSTTSSPIYFQHILTNAGNYTDTVTISSSITPTNWTVNASPSIVTLGVGVSTTIWVTITVPGGTTVGTVGVATITATSSISTVMTPRAVDTVYYQEDSNLSITKRVTPASGWLGPGWPVTYTLVYSTSGPSLAYGALITDVVPVTLTNVQYTASGIAITPTGSISYVWNVQTFSTTQVGYITITGRVKTLGEGLPQVVAPINNTATITSVQRDVAPGNNVSTATSLLDSAPPNVPSTSSWSPPNGTLTTSQAITFQWLPFDDRYLTLDGSGVVTYQLVITGIQGTSFYTSVTLISPTISYAMDNLPLGAIYTWTVRAFDAVGNASAYAPALTLAVDRPGLAVFKQATPANPVRGLSLTYAITIANSGQVPATNVVVTDALPTNANYISGGNLFDGSTITWTNITVGPQSSAQVTFVVSTCQASLANTSYRVVTSTEGISSTLGPTLNTILPDPAFVVSLTQSASQLPMNQPLYLTGTATTDGTPIVVYGWSFGDGQTATGNTVSHAYSAGGTFTIRLTVTDTCGLTATTTSTVRVIAPALGFSKTGPGTAGPGSPIIYTLVVSNAGLDDLHNVALTDTLPAFIIGGYATPAPLGGNSAIAAGTTVTWNVGLLPASSDPYTVTLVVTLTNVIDNGTVLTNTARARSDEATSPTAVVTTTVLSSPWLEITKNAPAAAWVASPLTYTIRYSNTGNANTTGVVLTDALPSNITGGYAVPPQTSGVIGANQVVTWDIGSLAGGGGNGMITLVVTVTNVLPNGTVITNTARVASDGGFSAETGPVTTTVYSAPRLVIAKSGTPSGVVSLGSLITYTLGITNTGSENAIGVTITDVTPLSTTFASAGIVPPATGTITAPAQGEAGAVIWNLSAPIAVGASASVTFTVRVTTTPQYNNTPIVNWAYTATAQNTVMPATGNPVTNLVRALPNLSITKSAPASVIAMTPLQYTIRYTNTGDGHAAGVVVTDALPLNISGGYAAPPPVGGNSAIIAGSVITWNMGLLSVGSSGQIMLVVTPTQSFMGTLLNTAGITCSDGVGSATTPVLVLSTHGSPTALAISPQGATVSAGQTQTYTVSGTDAYGNNWNATSEVTFTAGSGGVFGTPPGNNVFTATTPVGTHIITATAPNGTLITTTVNVTMGLAVSLMISPRDITVSAGTQVAYTSRITDAYGNSGDGTSSTTFTAGGGNVFSSNVLSATVAGTWTVTGTFASAVNTTGITITPLAPYTLTLVADPSLISPTSSSNVRARMVDWYDNPVGDHVVITFAATLGTVTPVVTETMGGLANAVFTAGSAEGTAIVTATTSIGLWNRTSIVIASGTSRIYLPLVMRNYSYNPGKNLIVSKITPSSSNPAATVLEIQNTGSISVTEGFYVVLYLDPTQTIQINQFWQQVGSPYGITWGIGTPLLPGQTMVLTPSSPSVYTSYTSWPASFSAGSHNLWAQVDMYNSSGTTGLVQETNESDNIAGPVTLIVP
jgi:uncharacterized repeat protein (TIGR01451 family)